MIGHRSIEANPFFIKGGSYAAGVHAQFPATESSKTLSLYYPVQMGDLLIVMLSGANASVSNWNGLSQIGSNYSNPLCAVAYKVCDGSEGSSFTVTLSSSVTSQICGMVIKNVSASPLGNNAGSTSGGANASSLATANIGVSGGSIVFVWNCGTGAIVSSSNSFTMLYESSVAGRAMFYRYYDADATSQGSTIVNSTFDRHRTNIFEIKLQQ